MRKALLGFLMAATAAMPVAAQAQQGGVSGRAGAAAERAAERYRQLGERNQARSERRQENQTQRTERREVRQEARQEARQEVRQVERQAPVQQQQSWAGSRGSGGGGEARWNGRDRDGRDGRNDGLREE
ncbi:MAG TPA: hypothetical protein VFR28_05615, partial [Allosphingosinicella sp.]|nr:hypothetical protein [Allosphingosinicella sp.]